MRSLPASTWARAKRLHVQDELEEIANENRIVVEIEHKTVDAAQVGCFRTGPFDPSLDGQSSTHLVAETGHAQDPVVHASSTQGIGPLQRRQPGLVGQQGRGLVDRRRLVLEELDGRSAVRGFPGRVRDDRHIVEPEAFRRQDLHSTMIR